MIPAFARRGRPEIHDPLFVSPFVGDGRDRPLRWGFWIPPVEEWLIFHGAGMTDSDCQLCERILVPGHWGLFGLFSKIDMSEGSSDIHPGSGHEALQPIEPTDGGRMRYLSSGKRELDSRTGIH